MTARAQRGRLRLVEPSPGVSPEGEESGRASLASLPNVPPTQDAGGTLGSAGAGGKASRRDSLYPLPRRDSAPELETGVTPGTPTPPPVTSDASDTSDAPARGRHRRLPEVSGTLDTLPDAQLVPLAQRGDRAALALLYRRHAAFAINLATRIEGSARDVEDIAHDAFVRAFERLNDLSDPAAFKSWLGSIVVHKVRSRMRRGRLLNLLGMGRSSEPVDLDALASPDASPHTRAQIAQIYALLQTLPADDRIAWILRAVEGHDLDTVARMVSCSLATVKRRITRAQQFLDEHFVDPATSEVAS
ncbi:RNA polymerase sigma factor [Chondromyces apiculatus]|nr:RNA polymerase sigma factor [Chondromyces apiculatus]